MLLPPIVTRRAASVAGRLTLVAAAFFALAVTACEPAAPTEPADGCTVISVTDGDTIRVGGCGDEPRIRLLLIDTPEIKRSGSSAEAECYGNEAAAYVAGRLPVGTAVRLEAGIVDRDQFGRLLRFVWLGDELLNETIVREGFATRYRPAEETRFVDRIIEAESDARAARRGMWSAACDGKR